MDDVSKVDTVPQNSTSTKNGTSLKRFAYASRQILKNRKRQAQAPSGGKRASGLPPYKTSGSEEELKVKLSEARQTVTSLRTVLRLLVAVRRAGSTGVDSEAGNLNLKAEDKGHSLMEVIDNLREHIDNVYELMALSKVIT
jgi:hypothetical protein